MPNNPYTVLSKQPKQKKSKQKSFEKVCVMCRTNKQNYSNGDFKSWCKSCALVDMYITDWNDACFNESLKPKNEQNTKVYQGSF